MNYTEKIQRNLTGGALVAHGGTTKVAFSDTAVNLGSLLTKGQSYFLIATEACHVCQETSAVATSVDANDQPIPAWHPWPFVPQGDALGLSVVQHDTGGDLFVVPAKGYAV